MSIRGTYFTSHAGLRLTALCGWRLAALRVSPATTAGLQESDVAPLAPSLHSPFFLMFVPLIHQQAGAAGGVPLCSWGDCLHFCTCTHGCIHASVCKSSKESCAFGQCFQPYAEDGTRAEVDASTIANHLAKSANRLRGRRRWLMFKPSIAM